MRGRHPLVRADRLVGFAFLAVVPFRFVPMNVGVCPVARLTCVGLSAYLLRLAFISFRRRVGRRGGP